MLIQRLSLASEIDVDKVGVALVASACEQLAMAKGAVTFSELWPGDVPKRQTILNDRIALERAQAEFWKLKRAARTLEALQVSLRTKLRPMERFVGFASQRNSIQHFPLEVLMEIIAMYEQMVTEDFESYTYPHLDTHPTNHFQAREKIRKLALVNRQFRDAVYKLPQCFADVGFDFSCEYSIRRKRDQWRIARFRNSVFNLYLPVGDAVGSWKNAILSGDPLFKKARSVWLAAEESKENKKVGSITLPKLLKMRLQVRHQGPPVSATKQNAILACLSTPCLKELRLSTLDKAYPKVVSSVTSLDIGPSRSSDSDPSAITKLFEALSAIPALRYLTLHFYASLDLPTLEEHALPKLILPNVETFRLLSANHGGKAKSIRSLMKHMLAIKMPSITDLTVDAREWDLYREDVWRIHIEIQCQFFSQPHPRLQTLRLLLFSKSLYKNEELSLSWSTEHLSDFLPVFLERCPSVRSLEYTLPTTQIKKGFNLLARLEHLTIHYRDCKSSAMKDMLVTILAQNKLALKSINLSDGDGFGVSPNDTVYWQNALASESSVMVDFKLS